MKQHANIPIFIPHLGCPNDCVFCNQRTISGVNTFDPYLVERQISEALATIGDRECEIAYFGGSFTGIDRELMVYLLKVAKGFVDSGQVKGIRCSTRPDYIDECVLSILKAHCVTTVELGIQSISDDVLLASKRGHTFRDTERACHLVNDYGFDLVGQMMIGLPHSTELDERRTAEFIARSGAVAARIYPTVVFKDTELCEMSISALYEPLSLDEAVSRTALAYEILSDASLTIIRVGLCSSENLNDEDKYYAGPNHAALGELVENEIYFNKISREINTLDNTSGNSYTIYVPKGHLSKAIGQNKRNKIRLIKDFGLSSLRFLEDDSITAFGFTLVQERK